MARNVATYISNLGKSVVYSTVDKVKKEMPATAEFKESNQELFKDIYDNIYNYRAGMKRSFSAFKSSKLYEAADLYKNNLIRDIKAGTFYNKKAQDKATEQIFKMNNSDFDLDGDMKMDTDFDIGGWDDDDSDDYNTTDSGRNASAISMAIAKTGEYVVENQRVSNNIFYNQAIKSNRRTNKSLEYINQNIGSIINFSNDVVKVHVQNSKTFYEQATKLITEQNQLLKDIHKKIVLDSEQKEEKSKEKITFDNMVGANGSVDLKDYFNSIKKNATNQLSTFDLFSGMGENPLLAFAASPLSFIPNAIAKKLIPDMLSKSMNQLDESISGLFGSLISKFNDMRRSDNTIISTIGQILGITNRTKGSLDTSKYNRGPIQWDGEAKKSLVEVIPNQLAEIISLISGKEKKLYDFDKGRFVEASNISKILEDVNTKYANQASADIREEFNEMLKFVTFNSVKEREELNKDINKFFNTIFRTGIMFNPNNKDLKYEFSDISDKNYALISKMFQSSNRSTQLKFNGEMLSARDRQFKQMEKLEQENSILNNLFNNSGISLSVDKNKKNEKAIINTMPNIKNIKDNKGNNVFFYLQNMYKQLVMLNGKGGIASNTVLSRPSSTIIDSNGNIKNMINSDFEIPDNRKIIDEDSINKAEKEKRQQEKYLEREKKRLEKYAMKVSMSDLVDGKDVENAFDTALNVNRIKTQLENQSESKKRGLINKLIEADTISDKMKVLLERVNDISKKPVEFFSRTLDKVDQRLYEVIYGNKENNNSSMGFMEALVDQVKGTFKNVNNWLDEHVLSPIKDRLDVEDFREIPKALLKKVGIDLDEIKSTIKDKLFGKDGIFEPIKQGIKNAFKGAYDVAKTSVKSAFAPITDKLKERRQSNKASKDIEQDLDNLDEIAPIKPSSPIKNMRKQLLMNGINMDEYSKMTNKQKQEYLKRYLNYRDTTGVSSIDLINEAKLNKNSELQEFNKYKNIYNNYMNEIDQATQTGNMSNSRYDKINRKMKKLQDKMDYHKGRANSATDYIHNITIGDKEYQDHKKRLEVINKQNIARESKEYYGEKLQKLMGLEDGSDVDALQKAIARYSYKNYKDDAFIDNMTIPAIINSATWLGQHSKDGSGKYDSLIGKLSDFTKAAQIKDGMSIENIIKRNISNVKEDKKETNYDDYKGLISGNLETGKDLLITNKLLRSVQNIEKYVFALVSRAIRKSSNIINNSEDSDGFTNFVESLPVPTDTHPALKTHEGQAMKQVASKIGDLVANWFGGNIRQFAEGGGIDKTQMVTVSEGEAVLNKDDVKTLSELMSKLTDSIVTKKDRSSKIAKENFGPLVSMAKKLGIDKKSDILSLLNKYEDKEAIRNMDEYSKDRYSKILESLSSNVSKASTLKEDISNKFQDNVKPFIRQAGDTIKQGAVKASDALFGRKPEEEREQGFKLVKDAMKDAKMYLPELSGGAALGAGLSLLTGGILGPIAGAAIGAGIGLTKKSSHVQEWLFGKIGEDGEREGGVVGPKTIRTMKKYLPDLKKYGITGGLAGLLPFLPFGPVGGLMIGSAFSYAKNNENIQKALFGKDGEKGLIPTTAIKKIKKIVPNVALGAAGGLMFGPFGLLGNMVLGSGVGYLTTSQKFQNMLLGTYNPKTKQYEDGILPDIRERFISPLRDDMKKVTEKIGEFVDKEMLTPLRSALKPISKQLQVMGKSILKGGAKIFDKFTGKLFGTPISQIVRRKIIQPLADTATAIRQKTMGMVKSLITLPFKAIGKVGESLTRRQIRKGNADYMTAEERLEWRKNHKMRGLRERAFDKIKHNETLKSVLPESIVKKLENNLTLSKDKTLTMDEFLANAEYSDLESMKKNLDYVKTNRSGRRKKIKKYSDKIVKTVYDNFGDLDDNQIGKALKSFKKADANSAFEALGIQKLDKETSDMISKYTNVLSSEGTDYTKLSKDKVSSVFKGNKELVNDIMGLYSKGDMEGLQSLLEQKLSKKKANNLLDTLKENINSENKEKSNREATINELREKLGDDISGENKERIIQRILKGQDGLASAMISANRQALNNDKYISVNNKHFAKSKSIAEEIENLTNVSMDNLKSGLTYKDQIDSAMNYVKSGDIKGLEKYLTKYVEDPEVRQQMLRRLKRPSIQLKNKIDEKHQNYNNMRFWLLHNSDNSISEKTRRELLDHLNNKEYDKYEALLKKKTKGIDIDSRLDTLESLYDDTDEYGKYSENAHQQGAVIKELQRQFKKAGIKYKESNSDSIYDYLEKELKNRKPEEKVRESSPKTEEKTQKDILETEKKNHNEIVTLFKDAIDLLKQLTNNTNKEQKQTKNSIGRFDEDGKFVPASRENNEEHGVMRRAAKGLSNHILEWFEGNLSQYANGGFIETPKMATLSAGEFVLTKDNTSELFGLSKIAQEELNVTEKNHNQIVKLFTSAINSIQSISNPFAKPIEHSNNIEDTIKNTSATVNSNIKSRVSLLSKVKSISPIGKKDDQQDSMETHTDDGGIIRYKLDSRGNKTEDLSDKETLETIKEVKEKRSIMNRIADGLGNLKGLIGQKVSDKDDKKEGGLFSKLFKGIGKKLAMVAGIGIASKFLLPVIKPIWDDHLKPFLLNTLLPGLVKGTFTAVKAIAPTLISGLGQAFKFALTEILPIALPVLAGVGGVKLAGSLGKAAISDLFTGKKTVKDTLKNFGKKDIEKVKDKGLLHAIKHPFKTASAYTNRGISLAATGAGKVVNKIKGKTKTGEVIEKGLEGKANKSKGLFSKIASKFSRNKKVTTEVTKDAGKVMSKATKSKKGGKIATIANIATNIAGDVLGNSPSQVNMLDNVDISNVRGPEALIIKQIQITGQNIVNAILGNGGVTAGSADGSGSLVGDLASSVVTDKISSMLPGGKKKAIIEGTEDVGKVALEGTESASKAGFASKIISKSKKGLKSAWNGSKSVLHKIGKKAGKNAVFNSLANSTKNIGKLTEKVSRKNIIGQVLDFIKGILNNSVVKSMIGADAAVKIGNKLLPKVSKELVKNIGKASAKVMAKITGAISTAGILNVAWAATDFVVGYNNAASILGITEEPSFGMKVVAGLVKAVSGLFIITSLIPEKTWVDLFADTVLPTIGEHDSHLQQLRAQAQNEVAQYNAENGTDLSLEDYNDKVNEKTKKTSMVDKIKTTAKKAVTKVKDGVSSAWKTVKNVGSKVIDKGKKVVSKAWNATKNVATKAWNGVKNTTTKIASGVKNVASSAWNATKNGVKSAVNWFTGNGEEENTNNSQLTGMGGQKKSNGVKPQIKNNMVYYSQGDSRWADRSYGTASMKASACGPTSAAMVLSTLTGQNITPVDTAQYSLDNGFRVPNVGTSWGLFPSIGKKYGIDFRQTSDKQSILSALKKKQPVILSGQGQVPFTRGGHFIVAAGVDKNNNILINDPVSLERSKAYDQNIIWSGMRAGFIANKSIDGKLKDNTASGPVISNDEAQQQQQEQQKDNRPSAFNFFSDLGNAFKAGFEQMYNTRAGGFGEADLVPVAAMGNGGKYMVSNALINYIKYKEGFFPNPYYDSGGVLTIGYGSTHGPIMKKKSVTEAEATAALKDEVNDNAKSVANVLKQDGVNATQSQFDAIVDFVYNAGLGSYQGSTLRKRIKAKASNASIKDAFLMWVKDDAGNRLPGLVTRRTDEARMYANEKGIAHYDGNGGTPVADSGSSNNNSSSNSNSDSEQQDSHSIFNIFDDLGNALRGGFDTMYGFNKIDNNSDSNNTGNGEGGSNSTGVPLNGLRRTADDFFTRTLNGRVTSGIDPNRKLMGQSSPHYGIDYAAKQGTPIKSPISGVVTTNSNEKDGFGNYIVIRDQNGQSHIFGHMNKQSNLKVGQRVSQGQDVGNVGSTGFSTGSHLHYEVRDDRGNKLNPNNYLNSYASRKPVDLTPASVKGTVGNGKGGEQPIATIKEPSKYDKVLELILKALLKIADNSENLTKIVKILSENSNQATKDAIKTNMNKAKSSSSKVPVTNILADSLKNNSDSGNEFIFKALEALASE